MKHRAGASGRSCPEASRRSKKGSRESHTLLTQLMWKPLLSREHTSSQLGLTSTCPTSTASFPWWLPSPDKNLHYSTAAASAHASSDGPPQCHQEARTQIRVLSPSVQIQNTQPRLRETTPDRRGLATKCLPKGHHLPAAPAKAVGQDTSVFFTEQGWRDTVGEPRTRSSNCSKQASCRRS